MFPEEGPPLCVAGIKGVLVHNALASYKGLECTHSLCNAHHIRELVYIHEQENEKIWDPWAQEMIDLLLQALKEVDVKDIRKDSRVMQSCFSRASSR